MLHGSRNRHIRWTKKITKQGANVARIHYDSSTGSDTESEDGNTEGHCYSSESNGSVSLRIVPAVIEAPGGKSVKINVMQDDGNQGGLLALKIAQFLGLKGRPAPFTLGTAGGDTKRINTQEVDFVVKAVKGTFKQKVTAKVIDRVARIKPVDWNKEKKNWPHLSGITFPEVIPDEEVTLLLGNDTPIFNNCIEEVTGPTPYDPVARLTPLGWSAIGRTKKNAKSECSFLAHSFLTHQIEEEMSRFSGLIEEKNLSPFAVMELKNFKNERGNFDKEYGNQLHFKGDRPEWVASDSADTVEGWEDMPEWVASKTAGTVEGGEDRPEWVASATQTSPGDKPEWVAPGPEKRVPLVISHEKGFAEADYEERVNSDQVLTEILRKEFELNYVEGENANTMSEENKYAMEKLRNSRKKLQTGGYEMGVIWRPNEPDLPNNRHIAERRLKMVERSPKLADPKLREMYQSVFKGWIEKGYILKIEEVDPNESQNFLATFPVIELERQTTKIRVVVDSAQKCDGKSLNDAIFAGPNFINNLCEVLLRFRMNYIALAGDISEMYLRVKMKKRRSTISSHFVERKAG